MRLSLRARITVMFLGTVLGVGLALIGLVYAYLKLTPVPFMAQIPTPDEGLVIDGAVPIADEVLRRVLVEEEKQKNAAKQDAQAPATT